MRAARAAVGVWLAHPLACALAASFAFDRWIVEASVWTFAWMLAFAAIAVGVGEALRRSAGLALPRAALVACVGWALLGGWYGGPLVRCLACCAGTSDAGRPIALHVVDRLGRLVRVAEVGAEHPTFLCANTTWSASNRRGALHHGRFGVVWLDLQR